VKLGITATSSQSAPGCKRCWARRCRILDVAALIAEGYCVTVSASADYEDSGTFTRCFLSESEENIAMLP
jgi:hypothetical protein